MDIKKPRRTGAKGLFRATGNTAKPVATHDLTGEIIKVDALAREKDDFYPTPPEPTRSLLASPEFKRLRDFPIIWESAAGDGAMARELEAVGFQVAKSDLVDRGCGAEIRSFFDFKRDTAPSRAIVTNPPFDVCNVDPGWVRFALEMLGIEYMALLLPVNWMGSQQERGQLWAEHPPARVYVMRWRVDFTGQGAPPMLNAWYVWDRTTWTGDTLLRVLDRGDARQAELF